MSTSELSLPYSTIFNLIDSRSQVGMGVVKCSSGGTNESPGSNVTCSYGSGGICKQSTSSEHYVGTYSSNEANNPALLWSFELVEKTSGSGLSSQFINYGDYVRIKNYDSDFIDTHGNYVSYYITSPSCSSTNYAMTLSNQLSSNQIFKITTPPSFKEIDGSPVPSGAQIALEQHQSTSPWEGNYLYSDTSNTKGWVMSLNSSDATSWTVAPTYGTCFLPSEWDQNMYYVSGLNWGDKNYGQLFTTGAEPCSAASCSSTEYESSPLGPTPSAAASRLIVPQAPVPLPCPFEACPIQGEKNCPYFCKGNWKDQTSNTYNQTMCCSGLLSSSDTCHPSYCPQNTGSVPVYNESPSTCQQIMTQACTPENWVSSNPNTAYLGPACDSYIAQAPCQSSWNVAKTAVESFYTDGNDPTSSSLFVRKAIDLCNLFPGMCDDVLTGVCSKYTWDDMDPQKWISPEREGYDPYGTNLIDTCGCFLPMDQYVCENPDGSRNNECEQGNGKVSRTCNAVCGMPNGIKPLDTTGGNTSPCTGSFEQCGGATCVIDSVTFDQINSSNGGFSLTQACSESGQGPYICYLGNNIDLEGTGYGNIEIQQNCNVCYLFDPNDTSAPPTQVDCTTQAPSPKPSPGGGGNVIPVIEQTTSFISNMKWGLLIGGVLVILVMIMLLFLV